MDFRLPEGASHEGRNSAGNDVFRISIPLDEDGFLGRQCPSCDQVFRISQEDYGPLPDVLVLYCVYCGHHEGHSEFMTQQQRERLQQAAKGIALQMVSKALEESFGRRPRRPRRSGAGVQFTFRSKPIYPEPLPGIEEEQLVRQRTCSSCSIRYAVFGDHRFCPICGPLDALEIALDALVAEAAKLDALELIPAEARPLLREQGVFDRLFVDTLGRVVGIVETLSGSHFRAHVSGAEVILKGKGNVFQRLEDMAGLYSTHLDIDLRSASGVVWEDLLELWATRHVHTHNDGIVDVRYLRAVPGSPRKEGQRRIVTEADVRLAITQARALCVAMN
ncbi:hypothetical protein [Glycomyces tenuis]|uniref:hypothetical protein n=1 Tax=Glycomyces tenuis TaxID=58116 RepID=UPI000479A90E|nr:hypothetical protein [Glycomyces tenuis]